MRDPESGKSVLVDDMSYAEYRGAYLNGDYGGFNIANFLSDTEGAEMFDGDLEAYVKDEVNKLPTEHRDALNDYVKKIEVVKGKDAHSCYNRNTRVVSIRNNANKGDLIHELGHALETKLELYYDPEYQKIRDEGIGKVSVFSKNIKQETREGVTIQLLSNNKFVSDYQGRIYSTDAYGNSKRTKDGYLNTNTLLDYFSEGYRFYCVNPELLKKADTDLYNYIKGLSL